MGQTITQRVRYARPDVVHRFDTLSRITWLASLDGYVWVRRPGGNPFTMFKSDWERLTDDEDQAFKQGLMVKWGAVEESPRRRHNDVQPQPTNEVCYTAPDPRARALAS